MLLNSQQPGLGWRHSTRKQGLSCLHFISSFTSKNLYYTGLFWTAWMSVCSVDVWCVYICRENSQRETQWSWIAPSQHLVQHSMLGKGLSNAPGNLRKNSHFRFPWNERAVRTPNSKNTTHNFFTFTVLLKHYETWYTRLHKDKNEKQCAWLFSNRQNWQEKMEHDHWKLNRDEQIHLWYHTDAHEWLFVLSEMITTMSAQINLGSMLLVLRSNSLKWRFYRLTCSIVTTKNVHKCNMIGQPKDATANEKAWGKMRKKNALNLLYKNYQNQTKRIIHTNMKRLQDE